MHNYTLKISENNAKALALLNYLKTLDFIEIIKTEDWWDELSLENQKAIKQGLTDIDNGDIHSDEDVRKSIHQRILNSQEK